MGKDTIASAIKIKKLPTYTTRKPRVGETKNREYYFISKKQFQKLIKNDEILEYNIYNNDYYGTSKRILEKTLEAGEDALFVIDVNGAVRIKKIYPEAVLIFIKSSLLEIEFRLMKRGKNTKQEIKNRLKIAEKELTYEKYYDYCVINPEGHPEKAIAEVEKIIKDKL